MSKLIMQMLLSKKSCAVDRHCAEAEATVICLQSSWS